MTVSTYNPQISVILKKNVGRSLVAGNIPVSERFAGTARNIDLTPYLGQFSSVVTRKSVREPLGAFAITLADNFAPGELESIYGLIEPMDVVEIRMARNVADYAGAYQSNMPITMRGFVRRVNRREAMTDQGPRRTVVIEGADYGYILDIIRYCQYPGWIPAAQLLSVFSFFSQYGIGSSGTMDAAAFIEAAISKIANPFIANMQGAGEASTEIATGNFSPSPVMQLGVQAIGEGGTVFPAGIQQWPGGGTLDGMLRYYGDVGAWNELFVQDRESGPVVVYRPCPFLDVGGNWISAPYTTDATTRPATITVVDDALVDIQASRGDNGVANYYWVDNEWLSYAGNGALLAQLAAVNGGKQTIPTYPNAAGDIYGFRMLRVTSEQGPRFDIQKAAQYSEGLNTSIGVITAKANQLIAQNKDNIVFETGSMQLRGSETLLPGCYVKLLRGGRAGAPGFTQTMYAHTVSHQFLPFRTWTTSIDFDRGTGFINRIQRGAGADSPYLAEMRPQGVYG